MSIGTGGRQQKRQPRKDAASNAGPRLLPPAACLLRPTYCLTSFEKTLRGQIRLVQRTLKFHRALTIAFERIRNSQRPLRLRLGLRGRSHIQGFPKAIPSFAVLALQIQLAAFPQKAGRILRQHTGATGQKRSNCEAKSTRLSAHGTDYPTHITAPSPQPPAQFLKSPHIQPKRNTGGSVSTKLSNSTPLDA